MNGGSDSWLERRGSVAAAVVAAWTLLAAIPATSAFIASGQPEFATWWRIFVPMVTYYYLWALVSPLVYRVVARWPLAGATRWQAAALHAAIWLAFTTLTPFIVFSDNWPAWLYGTRAYGYHAMGAFTYLLTLMGCLALKHYRQGLAREREAARAELRNAMLRGQLSLARIDALRMQINPHFLFNALNSIGALIETGRRDEAYRTTELLGGLLRSALEPHHQETVPLDRELAFVQRYLEIEAIRFGDKLRFETDIQADSRDCEVPALILQPLVENAIKHAVAPSAGPVRVVLRARLDGDVLVIEVADDGPGFAASASTPCGQGLNNVRERLALLFGDDACLEFASGDGARVTLRLPAMSPPGQDDLSPTPSTESKPELAE